MEIKSILIKDTTREERIRIVQEGLNQCGGACDFCNGCDNLGGGSVDAFVQIMNTRAQELGCTNTVFTNPTGLPDENQHITAHDMALIMEAAMANDTFRTIAATTSYTSGNKCFRR